MRILEGKPVVAALNAQLSKEAESLKDKFFNPTLGVLRVGENAGDLAYERGIVKRCRETGVSVVISKLPATAAQQETLHALDELNASEGIHGILLLRPLPKTLNEEKICRAVDPKKDVDGVCDASLAALLRGSKDVFAPCTAEACMQLLRHCDISPAGKRVVVCGRSLVIGKPLSLLLLGENATVTICHSRTNDLRELVRSADIVVTAIGRARFFDASYFKEGQIVLDVGMNMDAQGKLCGDVDFEAVAPIVEAITPVPNGIGTVTSSILIKHLLAAAKRAKV